MTMYPTPTSTALTSPLSMAGNALTLLGSDGAAATAARLEDFVAPQRIRTLDSSSDLNPGDAVAASATSDSDGSITLSLPTMGSSPPWWPIVVTRVDTVPVNFVTIAASEGQPFAGGGTEIVLQNPGESVFLLYNGTTWMVSARNGVPSVQGSFTSGSPPTTQLFGGPTVYLADPIWGGPVSGDPLSADWTVAQQAAALFLESLGGGTIVYPPGTLQFGLATNADVPGCLMPDNVFHVGGGHEATIITGPVPPSPPMTANLVQTMSFGVPGLVTQYPQIDHMTIRGSGAGGIGAVLTTGGFSEAVLPVTAIAADSPLTFAPVGGGVAWNTLTLGPSGGPNPPVASLSSSLSTSSPLDALPATASTAIPAGQTLVTVSGSNTQTWTTTAAVAAGATSIPVQPQYPNYDYPSGVAVIAAGLCWVEAYLVQYTGYTSTSLTGCSLYGGGNLPVTIPANAEVKPFNSQGHGLAFQASQAFVGRGVHVESAAGSNIFLQGGGPTAPGAQGHDIHPSRLGFPGRFQVEAGPHVTDGRMSGFSTAGGADGFATVLLGGGGDWDVSHIHPIAPADADCPAVICASSNVRITDIVGDTFLCPAVYLDNSGRYGDGGAGISDVSFQGYVWVNAGPQPPATPTAPLVLYRASSAYSGPSVQRGKIDAVSSQTSYSYGIQNGPTGHLGAPGGIGLPLTAQTLVADNSFGFDTAGGEISVDNSTGTPQTITYTGVSKVAPLTGSQPVATLSATITAGTDVSSIPVEPLEVSIPPGRSPSAPAAASTRSHKPGPPPPKHPPAPDRSPSRPPTRSAPSRLAPAQPSRSPPARASGSRHSRPKSPRGPRRANWS